MTGPQPTASAEVDPSRPYARKTFAEVVDDYVLVRGDLTERYAREQLVREHEARVQAARDEERARVLGDLDEGEKYAICKAAFEVYGPLGYTVGNHSSGLTDTGERVLAARGGAR
jgi:hypothetical protein